VAEEEKEAAESSVGAAPRGARLRNREEAMEAKFTAVRRRSGRARGRREGLEESDNGEMGRRLKRWYNLWSRIIDKIKKNYSCRDIFSLFVSRYIRSWSVFQYQLPHCISILINFIT